MKVGHKLMKRCSALLVIWKMQNKTALNCTTHFLKFEIMTIAGIVKKVEELKSPCNAGGNIKLYNHFQKKKKKIRTSLNNELNLYHMIQQFSF